MGKYVPRSAMMIKRDQLLIKINLLSFLVFTIGMILISVKGMEPFFVNWLVDSILFSFLLIPVVIYLLRSDWRAMYPGFYLLSLIATPIYFSVSALTVVAVIFDL